MPTTTVKIKDKIKLRDRNPLPERSLIDKRIAPKDAGMYKEKAKLKALTGERPTNRAAKIVEPARDTPGRMANA